MRTLTITEVVHVSGGIYTPTFGLAGALYGTYYGASVGAVLSWSFGFAGLMLSILAENGPDMVGLGISIGVMILGPIIGAIIGGTFGATLGVSSGYIIEPVDKTQDNTFQRNY